MQFNVRITTTKEIIVIVEAHSMLEAEGIAKESWRDGLYSLNAAKTSNTSFQALYPDGKRPLSCEPGQQPKQAGSPKLVAQGRGR